MIQRTLLRDHGKTTDLATCGIDHGHTFDQHYHHPQQHQTAVLYRPAN